VTRETRARATAVLVAAALFMELLDGTILVTAAPRIAADFGVQSADVNVVMTAYLIAVACSIPLGGWLASRLGARAVFCTSVAVFTIASLLCALSGDLLSLTLARVLQGLAGGMMVPVGRLVVLRNTDKAGLVRAIAVLTWPSLLAPVIAPVIGGFLTTIAGWQSIFLVNLPIGLAILVAALLVVRDVSAPAARPLDLPGLALCTLTVLVLLVALELAHSGDPVLTVLLAVVGLLLGGAAIAWLLRRPNPLLDLRIFRVPTFRVTNSGGFVYRLVISAVPFVLPLLFQDGFGWSPIEAGLAVTALFLGNVTVKPITTPLMRRFGFRAVLIGAVSGGIVALALFGLLGPALPVPLIWVLAYASGAARSIGFSAYNSIQFADVHAEDLTNANTLSATLSELGAALGIALAATSLRFLTGPAEAAGNPLLAYHGTFLALAALLVISLVSAVRLSADAGDHVSRAPRPSARARS
jgi:EmrB/QacA subfamily drug resistance transporter